MIKELTLKHLTIPTINLCKRYNCENNEIVTFIHNTSNLHSLFKFGAIPSCVWAVYRNSCSHQLTHCKQAWLLSTSPQKMSRSVDLGQGSCE